MVYSMILLLLLYNVQYLHDKWTEQKVEEHGHGLFRVPHTSWRKTIQDPQAVLNMQQQYCQL